jgi:hypothetical protein
MNGHDIMAFKEFLTFMHITVPYDFYSKDITPEQICLINKKLFMILTLGVQICLDAMTE